MRQPPGAAGAALEHRQRAALILFAWRSLQQQRGGQTGRPRKVSQWLMKEATGPTAAVAFRVREQKHRKRGRNNTIK